MALTLYSEAAKKRGQAAPVNEPPKVCKFDELNNQYEIKREIGRGKSK